MIVIFLFIFGLIVGSFLNVIIFRLKSKEQFIKGRSKCLACKHELKNLDLVPIFSFIFLKGKCRYCHKKISWQYPLVELITGFVFLIGYLQIIIYNPLPISQQVAGLVNGPIIHYLVYLIFSCFLIIIFVYDLKYYLILDKVSLSAFFIAILLNYILGKSIFNILIAAVIASGFFLLQFVVSKGKWIGGGDIRLGLVMGAMLGWPKVLLALYIAYIIGAIISLVLVYFKKKNWKSEVPFGTFLSLATWISLLWGEQIIGWYFG